VANSVAGRGTVFQVCLSSLDLAEPAASGLGQSTAG